MSIITTTMVIPADAVTIMKSMSIITTTMVIPADAVTIMTMKSMSITTTNMTTAIPAVADMTMSIIMSTAPTHAARSTSSRILAAPTALPRWKRKSTLCPA